MPDDFDDLDLFADDNFDFDQDFGSLEAIIKQPQSPSQPGDIELGTALELNDVLDSFKARVNAEAKRFELATDSEYWFCVCFQTREQKEAFLKAMRWFEHGDKYLDGQWVARQLNVDLPNGDVPYNTGKVDRKLAAIAQEFDE